ncbi:hypothetical protein SAMN05216464_12625 [Mucilaginibacter pineti]|uniref:Uncharacterized protein n=1 Tax=Mucilaginibacter pineti TaxID=1391627 RepID=A0A1G7NDF1_9SPHI|nr:hypothetical protein SAMN05216464_12625 [Mucilaginibacter pineti]
MSFVEKKISVKRSINLLAKNGIQVDDNEGTEILNFLYLIAKNYQYKGGIESMNLKEKSNYKKVR